MGQNEIGYHVYVHNINSVYCGLDCQMKVRLIIVTTKLLLSQNCCSKHKLQLYFTVLNIWHCKWFSTTMAYLNWAEIGCLAYLSRQRAREIKCRYVLCYHSKISQTRYLGDTAQGKNYAQVIMLLHFIQCCIFCSQYVPVATSSMLFRNRFHTSRNHQWYNHHKNRLTLSSPEPIFTCYSTGNGLSYSTNRNLNRLWKVIFRNHLCYNMKFEKPLFCKCALKMTV